MERVTERIAREEREGALLNSLSPFSLRLSASLSSHSPLPHSRVIDSVLKLSHALSSRPVPGQLQREGLLLSRRLLPLPRRVLGGQLHRSPAVSRSHHHHLQ